MTFQMLAIQVAPGSAAEPTVGNFESRYSPHSGGIALTPTPALLCHSNTIPQGNRASISQLYTK